MAASGFDEVIRTFEKRSDEAHARDPKNPVYRIIVSQDANYDMTGDPTRFVISIAGGMPPDVVRFDRYAIAEWASRGAFHSLNDYLASEDSRASETRVRKEDFYPSTWAEAEYKGEVYAIPYDTDSRALLYNKSLFRRAGIVDENGEAKPPTTWSELREYADRLNQKTPDGRFVRIGFAPNYGNSWLYMFGFMAGAQFMTPDGLKVTLSEEPVVRALTFMRNIYDDAGGFANVMGFQAGFQGGFQDPFVTGQVAMKIDSLYSMAWLGLYGRDLDFGVVPPPLPDEIVAAGGDPVSWSGGFGFAIPVNAHEKDAAWEFIRFSVSDEAMRIFAEAERETVESVGYPFVPNFTAKPHMNEELVNHYVFNNPRSSPNMRKGIQVYLDLLPYSKFRPVTPVAQLLWTNQVSAMEEALYHRKEPKEALAYAEGLVQRELDKRLAPPVGIPFRYEWFYITFALLLVSVVSLVYTYDTRAGVRRFFNRLMLRKKSIGEGDVVEGARGGYFRQQWIGGLLCVSPWIIGFVIFHAGPLLFSVIMSFCDYDILSPPRMIGLSNYEVLLFEDELMPKALWNTFYMLVRVPLGMALGLGLAMLLDLRLRGMSFFRTLFYLPSIVPVVAVYILWSYIFNPSAGPLNSALAEVGIRAPNWLQDESWSKPSVILMSMWGVGGGMILWLAGLRGISPDLYEAAELDGANGWQTFRHITIPQLSPYILFNLIMGLIAGFKIFDEAFIMTRGGPVNSTLFYVYHLFNHAFRYGHMGYASAMAWMLFLVILIFTFVALRWSKRWVHYEHD